VAVFAEEKKYDPFTLKIEDVKERLDKMPAIHPRLFVKRSDTLAVISWNIDKRPEWRMIRDWIIREADSYLDKKPTKRKKQGFRMQGQHAVQRRVVALSSAYWFTEDMKYVERAKQEMLAAADFTDWNPAHFLDTAEMTMGLAVGYDWLYDVLDEQSKVTIRKAIVEKGLKQSLVKKYFWTKGNNNWSQVCWGGMTAGALAVRDEEPELALEVLHKAITGVPYSIKVYAPNGCYPEGPGYWTYGTGYFVYMMDMLEKSLGTNFGLYDLPGFSETGEFFNLATGTSGSFYNYADGGKNRVHNLSMWWLAARAKRDDWLVKEHKDVLAALKSGKPESSALRKVSLRILLLLWMKDIEDDIEVKMPLCWSSGGHVPIVVMRSAWNDSNAAFLATKGGPASQNHGHMDSGSFVYDVDGVRWAVDLGSQSYYSIEKLGMSLWSSAQDSDRWKIFRLNSRSHNLVTIDDQLHYVKGHGKVAEYNDDPGSPSTVIDLKDVYKGQVASYKRTFKLLASRAAHISDDITGVKAGAKVRWAMVTAARDIQKEGSSLVLRQGDHALLIKPLAPAVVSWQIDDLTTPPNEWDVSNKGNTMVSFSIEAPASGRVAFEVELAPRANK
jgi:hypothetical protein